MSGRLDQIKKTMSPNVHFGNVSVLLVGDLFQIPPVNGCEIFKEDPGSLIDLWRLFHVYELDEIMRKQGDREFAQMLNRLRVKFQGDGLLPQDKGMFDSYLMTWDSFEDTMHVYPVNCRVDEYNMNMLQKLQGDVIPVSAVDFKMGQSGTLNRRKEPYTTIKSISLPCCVSLAVGARVVLTSNVNVHDGLVNGALGIIIHISMGRKQFGETDTVVILAEPALPDLDSRAIAIHPLEEQINSKETRRQFPLKLSWACTMHKTQGMTVENIVVSLKGTFKEGMGYVALSWRTSLKGLHLLDYKDNDIFANKRGDAALEKKWLNWIFHKLHYLLLPAPVAHLFVFSIMCSHYPSILVISQETLGPTLQISLDCQKLELSPIPMCSSSLWKTSIQFCMWTVYMVV